MYVLLVCHQGPSGRYRIHVVDDDGRRAHSAADVGHALRWLWDRDERQVVAMTDVGPELFLIEECSGLTMTLPSYSMRRAFHGVCADVPEKLGVGPDPTLRPRVLEDRQETAKESRERRARWVRRATAHADACPANDNRSSKA